MADAREPLLECREVSASYGGIRALHRVSLGVRRGEIVSVIGANGAGKTTLLRTIMGFLPPREGSIVLAGRDVSRRKPHEMARLRVAYVPEGRELFPSLSVLENLSMGRTARSSSRTRQEDLREVFDLFPVLADRRLQPAGTLSGGEQQMLAMARGLVSRPELCLMDEPSLGLAPKMRRQVFDLVGAFRSRGASVLLVEQNARQALQICDRAFVLDVGEVVMAGTGRELAADPSIERAYLGRRRDESSIRGRG